MPIYLLWEPEAGIDYQSTIKSHVVVIVPLLARRPRLREFSSRTMASNLGETNQPLVVIHWARLSEPDQGKAARAAQNRTQQPTAPVAVPRWKLAPSRLLAPSPGGPGCVGWRVSYSTTVAAARYLPTLGGALPT